MALIGQVRVSTDKQNTQRQHDALDPICWKVFEEKISGKLATDDRPVLLAALDHVRDGDLLAVQEVDRLGRNLLEGLIVLNDLFQRGVGVKALEGIAAGEHTEHSLILDLALALSEDRRRDIVRKTKNGLEAARKSGRVGGRRPVVDDDKRAAILSRRERGESIRTIAAGVKVSVGVVHKTLADAQRADADVEQETPAEPIEKPTQATKSAQVAGGTAEPTPWERYGDPAARRRWYTDDELAAVQLLATGDVDGSQWVIVAGDILGTVQPNLSARGTRSGWQTRHRSGTPAYHLSGKGRSSHPATRGKAVTELVADVRHRWTEQQRRGRNN
ncbi:recombinase family protein [Streptosporangium sp. NPDC006930]|uniref:recombinase family protein n=1 Tax=unclassified Streptosporangium TaxID=2632669 RepID=UPI00343F01F8